MKALILIVLILIPQVLIGQTFILKSSKVSFFSEAPLENIQAITTTARGIFQAKDGQVAFQIPIKTFQFEKALMQEHFNENYMESEKFPYATFSGKIDPYKNLPGKNKVSAVGKLTIHGVSREVSVDGSIELKNGQIIMSAKFPVRLQDYNIEIPQVVFYKIAEIVDVDVEFLFSEKK